jgi:ABC-type phosphate/phosphonate transport system permease subunit
MKEKRLFLQWTAMASLIVVGAVFAHRLGWLDAVIDGDATRLSFVILAIFAAATAAAGQLAWRASGFFGRGHEKGSKTRDAFMAMADSRLDDGAAAVGVCTGLGLLGTVIGIIMAFPTGGFSAIIAGDASAMGPVLDQLTRGFSTAYLTTAVGLICGILLDIQLRIVARWIEVRS